MYLIDTNVISEARKKTRANPGVTDFLRGASRRNETLYLSVVTIGELRRGVGLIRDRGDTDQADRLESWLQGLLEDYRHHILDFDLDAAQVWGRLRVPDPAHELELEQQIAATALVYDLTVVTRNVADFGAGRFGLRVLNPFSP